MIKRRNFIWLIPLVIIVSFPLWEPSVASFLAPRGGYDPSFANRRLDAHNFAMEGVSITQSENGIIGLKVQADRIYTGNSSDEFRLDEVDAVVISDQGDETYITSRNGIMDKTDGIFTLIDEVVVMQPKDKLELYTDLLLYNQNSRIANSPGKTQVLNDKINITGNNLTFNTITNAYDLEGRIRCMFNNFSAP